MSVLRIGNRVREVVRERLSDPTTGLNPNLAAACADSNYNIPAISFDFSDTSVQVWEGYLNPEQLDETSVDQYPLLCFYTKAEDNLNRNKFSTFSGKVIVHVDIYLSFENSAALRQFDNYADAVTAAIVETFNAPLIDFQDCGWGGSISMVREPMVQAAENWLQKICFVLPFDFDVT
jgi:hypothetical protein